MYDTEYAPPMTESRRRELMELAGQPSLAGFDLAAELHKIIVLVPVGYAPMTDDLRRQILERLDDVTATVKRM